MAVDNQYLEWLAQPDVKNNVSVNDDERITSQMFREVFEEPAAIAAKSSPVQIAAKPAFPALAVAIADSDEDDDDQEVREGATKTNTGSVDDYDRVAEADKIEIFRPHLDGLLRRFNLI